jgi:hypothetical protein
MHKQYAFVLSRWLFFWFDFCLYCWLFLYPNSLGHHILPSSLDTLSSYYKRFGIYYNPVKWEKCSACTYFVSSLSDIYRKEAYWFNLQIRSWLRVLDLFHFKIKLNGDFLFFKCRTLSSSFIYLCTLLSSTTRFWKQYPYSTAKYNFIERALGISNLLMFPRFSY